MATNTGSRSGFNDGVNYQGREATVNSGFIPYAEPYKKKRAEMIASGGVPADATADEIAAAKLARKNGAMQNGISDNVVGNYDAYENPILAVQKNAYNAQLRGFDAQRQQIRSDAENASRQAYVSRMLRDRDLEQQLTASGSSGGMSDSAYLASRADYENQRYDIGQQMNQNLAQVDLAEANAQADYDMWLAQQQAAADAEAAKLAQQTSGSYRSSGNSSNKNTSEVDADEYTPIFEEIRNSKYPDIALSEMKPKGISESNWKKAYQQYLDDWNKAAFASVASNVASMLGKGNSAITAPLNAFANIPGTPMIPNSNVGDSDTLTYDECIRELSTYGNQSDRLSYLMALYNAGAISQSTYNKVLNTNFSMR